MFAPSTKVTQTVQKARQSIDNISLHLIKCANRDLLHASNTLDAATEKLVKLQKDCQKEDLENQEKLFLDAIDAKLHLSDKLNDTLRRAALATRGAEFLTESIVRATSLLSRATRFVTCNVCHHHFLGEAQVRQHHSAYHNHIPFVVATHDNSLDDADSNSNSKVLRDDAASVWKASSYNTNTQYLKDYITVMRLKRRSTVKVPRSPSSPTSSSSSSSDSGDAAGGATSGTAGSVTDAAILLQQNQNRLKWNVDKKRWDSSMLYNATLTLKLLLDEQEDDGHWKASDSLAELMFCSLNQLRKNALTLFNIPFYPISKQGKKRTKRANIGEVMIHYLCTGAAIFHLKFILTTIQNDIRSSIAKLSRKSIANGVSWMQRCVHGLHYGGPHRVFTWISRNQSHWPSIRQDDFNIFINVRMIQAIHTSTTNRKFRTRISATTPMQSILMFLNTHFDIKYHYLQAHACCEIIVRYQKNVYIVFDQLNFTSNNMLLSIFNEVQLNRPLEIDIIFRELENGEYPKFRACIPTQIAIGGLEDRHLLHDVHIAIPHNATLYHLRQILADEMMMMNENENDVDDDEFVNQNIINEDVNLERRVIKEHQYQIVQKKKRRQRALLQLQSHERLKEIKKQYGTDKVAKIVAKHELQFHTKKAFFQYLLKKRGAKKAEMQSVASQMVTGIDVTNALSDAWKKMPKWARSQYFQSSYKDWVTSMEYATAQDIAMKLEIDLKEVESFLEFDDEEWEEDDNDDEDEDEDEDEEDEEDEEDDEEDEDGEANEYYSSRGKVFNERHETKRSMGKEDLATLTLHGPSNTHKSFCFVHRGLYLMPEEEATIAALDSAIQTGSLGVSANMEQHSRLVVLLQPATGVYVGDGDE